MKTYNYEIDLMLPLQANKEVTFNEAQLKIDSLCSASILGFIEEIPKEAKLGEKHIVKNGEFANYVCYCSDLSKGWQLMKAKVGMIFFIVSEDSFFIFKNSAWQPVVLQENVAINEGAFISIDDRFEAPARGRYLSLYLVGNCLIDLSKFQSPQLTVVIKQNQSASYKVSWSENIMWQQQKPHAITPEPNHIDVLTFYKLIEVPYVIASINGIGYHF